MIVFNKNWNEPKSRHTAAGTIGKTINDLDSGVNKLIDVQKGNYIIIEDSSND